MNDIMLANLHDAVIRLSTQIEDIFEKHKARSPYSSDNTAELFAALAKAQGDYSNVCHNRENPYFKSGYADMDAIMKAVRPALAKNGLGFMQQLRTTDEGSTVLHSILVHASGQWIESRTRIIPVKNDPQTFGSTLTYQKRYAAVSLLGITISQDDSDDDGEVAMVPQREVFAKGTALNNKYNPKDTTFETITREQLEELEYELAEYPDIAEQVLDGLKIQSLADIPKGKFLPAIQRIRTIKATRNGVK